MPLAVLYTDKKGQRNIATCDQCYCRIRDEEFADAIALHKGPLDSGEQIVPLWFLHGECLRRFIDLNNFPRGKWYFSCWDKLGHAYIQWQELDLERFYAEVEKE